MERPTSKEQVVHAAQLAACYYRTLVEEEVPVPAAVQLTGQWLQSSIVASQMGQVQVELVQPEEGDEPWKAP